MASRRDRRAKGEWGGGASAAGASGSSYQSGASADSRYARLVGQIDADLSSLSKTNSALDKTTAKIGTRQDSASVRSSGSRLAHKAKQLLAKVLDQVRVQMAPLVKAEASTSGSSARAQQQSKFMSQAKAAGKKVQASLEEFQRKSKLVAAPGGAAAASGGAAAADEEQRALLEGTESRMAVRMADQARADLAREREQEAAGIAHDMAELGSMMHDLAEIVDDQQTNIDRAEANAKEAEDAAKAGNKHLDGATKQQSSYQRKLIIFVAVILLAAAGITVYFVLSKR